jgi:hypothetical protein
MAKKYTFHEFCRAVGKPAPIVHSLQTNLDLYVPNKHEGYPDAYLIFMEKVVAMRTFSVPLDEIADLFRKEKKILELLHVDTITDSPTWYLDACKRDGGRSDQCLLLTGHNLGFPIAAEVIQSNLDFGDRDPELFNSREMGEDVRKILRTYLKLIEKIKDRIQTEKPVIERALFWSEEVFF